MQLVRLTAGASTGTFTPDLADATCTPTTRLKTAASSLAIETASMVQSLPKPSLRLWILYIVLEILSCIFLALSSAN